MNPSKEGAGVEFHRRDLLKQSAALSAALATGVGSASATAAPARKSEPRYCLNTSTIRGQALPLQTEIELIAKAGYNGIEPWIREIQQAKDSGIKLSDIRKQLEDHGVRVESAIGFANWIVDDDTKRKQGLENLKRDMDLVRQIGGSRIAAPPTGGTNEAINLDRVAERYTAALEVGRSAGVTPLIELWGFSKSLHRLGELMYVIVESGEADAALLLDVYHIYKGGSDFSGLRFVDGKAVKVLHMNDYPNMPRQDIKDEHRVYPGEGVAPIKSILDTMRETGFDGVLSLELFNREYWKDDVERVLAKGLTSMKHAAEGKS